MTYKELVYMALDALKIHSDDSKFTEDHVVFLLNKYRAYALVQKYSKTLEGVNYKNYQTISVETVGNQNNRPGNGHYITSTDIIPEMINIALPRVQSATLIDEQIVFTNENRLRYTGYNRFLPKITYSCLGNDKHLWVKHVNEITPPYPKYQLFAVFANPNEAYDFNNDTTEVLDREFPLEESLAPAVLELVLKDLTNGIYKPSDNVNDAQDALSDLAGYLRRNMKSQFQKQIDE